MKVRSWFGAMAIVATYAGISGAIGAVSAASRAIAAGAPAPADTQIPARTLASGSASPSGSGALIVLPDATPLPVLGPSEDAPGLPLGYDLEPARGQGAEASDQVGRLLEALSGPLRGAYLLAHWRGLEGHALGEFAFKYMTPRTLSRSFVGLSMPLRVFRALPVLFPRRFPDPTFANFGFIRNPDDPAGLPLGLEAGGISPRYVDFTCAACHAATVDGKIAYGAPNAALRYGDLILSLDSALTDSRFTLDRIEAAAETAASRSLSVGEKAEISDWLRRRPFPHLTSAERAMIASWGPGRMDLAGAGFPTRIPSLYGARGLLNCDGSEAGLANEVRYHLFLRGLAYQDLETSRANRLVSALVSYVRSLRPPASDDFEPRGVLLRGKRIFDENCASCHVQRANQVLPLEMVGTDDKRFRQDSALSQLFLGWSGVRGLRVRLWPMVEVPPLEGLWFRTALLHNGSVQTLDDLLTPPDDRPPVFARAGSVFDTRRPGNSNRGHDFGTHLDPWDKAALIAYLRSL